jgi:hypothetical protein
MTGKIKKSDMFCKGNMFDGTNFSQWEINLRSVLRDMDIEYILHIGPEPHCDNLDSSGILKYYKDSLEAQGIILLSMITDISQHYHGLHPCDVMTKLRSVYAPDLRIESNEVQMVQTSSKGAKWYSVPVFPRGIKKRTAKVAKGKKKAQGGQTSSKAPGIFVI